MPFHTALPSAPVQGHHGRRETWGADPGLLLPGILFLAPERLTSRKAHPGSVSRKRCLHGGPAPELGGAHGEAQSSTFGRHCRKPSKRRAGTLGDPGRAPAPPGTPPGGLRGWRPHAGRARRPGAGAGGARVAPRTAIGRARGAAYFIRGARAASSRGARLRVRPASGPACRASGPGRAPWPAAEDERAQWQLPGARGGGGAVGGPSTPSGDVTLVGGASAGPLRGSHLCALGPSRSCSRDAEGQGCAAEQTRSLVLVLLGDRHRLPDLSSPNAR